MFEFTEKQRELISDFKHGRLKRINILDGSVRSGKTYSSLILWALWIATRPTDRLFLMVGRTLTTLMRNCLEPLQALLGASNLSYSISSKRGVLFGHSLALEGANDAQAEGKIRGITLDGAYVDEITLIQRVFFAMLLSRLSTDGARLFGTTNPDSPRHWLKAEYLDNEELDIYRKQFLLEDNTTLPPDYIENLRREYTGVFYQRFILGEWIAAEGAIYPMFGKATHISDAMPEIRMTWIAVDYGHTNPTAFVRLGMGTDGHIWVMDEYYHQSGRTGSKSPRQYVRDMIAFAARYKRPPEAVIIDPAAEGFILQLREDSALRIRGAHNAVRDGIMLVASALDAGVIRIHPRCKHLIDEIQGYAWDSKAQAQGEDRPVKANDHACDALRYGLMEYERDITRMVMEIGRTRPLPPDRLALARL